jgi:hypothetical protein
MASCCCKEISSILASRALQTTHIRTHAMPTRKVADLLFQREFLALQTANLLCHVLDLTRNLHFELLDMFCSWVQASRTQAIVI